jgi:4-hydroxymandelate oxidase
MESYNLEHYKSDAKSKLNQDIWHYLESSAGNGNTHTKNNLAWQQHQLMPRPLQSIDSANTRCKLFNEEWAHPIMLAPVAYQRLFHQDGEVASAMANNAQDGQMIVSALASQTLETIIENAQQPLWFQLYWQGNREASLRLVKRALLAGYNALVFTVDAPVKQAVMHLPDHVKAINLEQPLAPNPLRPGQSEIFEGWMQQAPTWDDLKWLRDQTQVPLLVKGILSVEDASRIADLGCEGIIVSNHGGRVIDNTPTSYEALPNIVNAVGSKCKLIVDSGIRSGHDVFTALALGADAVCIGRPYIWGLASEGALGVARVIRLLRDELEMTMALTGISNLQQIQLLSKIKE